MTRTFAVYGKGGIGKSTVSSNIAAVYGGQKLKTLLIGCDPKSDTAINIIGKRIKPLLEIMKTDKKPDQSLFLRTGFNDVACVEIGGPEPGVGCAGRGLIIGLKYLIDSGIANSYDLAIFDVPADIVCGGLAIVVKEGYAKETFIVSSDEFMSLFAANNLCHGFKSLKIPVCGLLYNKASSEGRKYIENFSRAIQVPIIGETSCSNIIQACDRMNKTAIEAYPDSVETAAFQKLANQILKNENSKVPDFVSDEALEGLRFGHS